MDTVISELCSCFLSRQHHRSPFCIHVFITSPARSIEGHSYVHFYLPFQHHLSRSPIRQTLTRVALLLLHLPCIEYCYFYLYLAGVFEFVLGAILYAFVVTTSCLHEIISSCLIRLQHWMEPLYRLLQHAYPPVEVLMTCGMSLF